MQTSASPAIVVFDGACALCDRAVTFIIDRDPAGHFRFVSRQSVLGRELLVNHGLPAEGVESLVLLEGGSAFLHSEAALRIARRLTPPWSWLFAFTATPAAPRDAVYRFVAKNRKRWGGSIDACAVPTPERRARLLT